MDPNIILVNVLATIGVVKAILWLLDTGEEELPAGRKAEESVDDETEMYLYAICICVSIILSIIILR